jgi:hypothetical protein
MSLESRLSLLEDKVAAIARLVAKLQEYIGAANEETKANRKVVAQRERQFSDNFKLLGGIGEQALNKVQ